MEQWPNLYQVIATKCEFRTLQPNHSVTSRTKILNSVKNMQSNLSILFEYTV